jgi:hypothetical protein
MHHRKVPLRLGAVDIEFASGTEDPGSNPAMVQGVYVNMAMLLYLYIIDLLCFVCVLKRRNKGFVPKIKIIQKITVRYR